MPFFYVSLLAFSHKLSLYRDIGITNVSHSMKERASKSVWGDLGHAC